MKTFKCLVILFCSFFSAVFGSDFQKDFELISTLGKNNVRLVVLCCFQGTNNLQNIITSSRSPGYPLTCYGIDDLNNLIPTLMPYNISQIVTSPVYRAQQATNLLATALNLTPAQLSLDSRLMMQNFGSSEGMDYGDYKKSFTLPQTILEGTPPNGEPGISVFKRTHDFLKSLELLQNQTILIITHGFNYCHISKCLTGKFGNLPELGSFVVYDFSQNSN